MNDTDPGQGGRPRRPRDDVDAELAVLWRVLRETDDIARQTAGVVSEMAPTVLTLDEQVTTLRSAVAKLIDHGADTPAQDPELTAAKAALGMRPEPPGPWCWPLLDAEQAAAAWDALACWVGDVLVPGYELTRGELSDCWPRHPRMVAELSWLRQAYLEAHLRGAAADRAQDWHVRALPGALVNITAATPYELNPQGSRLPLCGPGHHLSREGIHSDEDEERRRLPALGEHWRQAWRDAKTTDLAARRPAPAA